MDYTAKDLDRACVVILERAGVPTANVEIMQQTISRPVLCKVAAEEAFKGGFPDAVAQPRVGLRHACNILRHALNELSEHGQFKFQPEDEQ